MENLISTFEKKAHCVFPSAIARKLRTCVGALIAMAFFLVSPMANSADFTVDTSTSAITGLWWNQNESGWGAGLIQQYGVIFVTLFTYDSEGKPTWYVASNCAVSADGCTGDLYAVTGASALTVPWNDTNKIVATAGTVNFRFTDANTGTMNYTINGVAGSKAITRQIFATAPVQADGFPFVFKEFIRLNSMTFSPIAGDVGCTATLSFTSTTAIISSFLYFDVLVDGVTTGQTAFFGSIALPPATSTSSSSIIARPCGTFTLRFKLIPSQVI